MVARLWVVLSFLALGGCAATPIEQAVLQDPSLCRLEPADLARIQPAAQRSAGPAQTAARIEREIAAGTMAAGPLATAHLQLGIALRQSGRLVDARAAFERALALREQSVPGDDEAIGIAQLNLGMLHREMGHPLPAAQMLSRALERLERRHGGRHRLVAVSLTQLAMAELDSGAVLAAAQNVERAAAIQGAILGPSDPAHIDTRRVRGLIAAQSRRYSDAIEHHQRAIEIARFNFAQAYIGIPNGFHGLSIAFLGLGHVDVAKRCAESALAIRDKTFGSASQSVVLSLHTMARIALATGNLGEAKRRGDEARASIERFSGEDNAYVALSLLNLGNLYRSLNDLGAARQFLERALAIAEREFGPNHEGLTLPLTSLAGILADAGERGEALRLQRRALAIRSARLGPEHWMTGISHAGVASVFARAGALEEAQEAYDRAFAIFDRSLAPADAVLAPILVRYAAVLARRDARADAHAALERSLAIVGARGFAAAESWPVFHAYSRSLAAQGDRAAAIYFAKQAVNGIQTVRETTTDLDESHQQSFLADKTGVYRNLADLLIDAGRLGEALEVLRLQKREEFQEFIQRDATERTRPGRLGLTPDEERIGTAVGVYFVDAVRAASALERITERARLGPGLSSADATERQRLQTALQGARDQLRRFLAELPGSLRPATRELRALNEGQLDGLRQELRKRPRTAILHYVTGPERLSIILTLPGVNLPFQYPIGDEALHREIVALLGAIGARRDPRAAARSLYDKLVAPVEKELAAAETETLLVSLDGALRYVPFAVLFDGERYLVERYAVTLLTEAAKVQGISDRPAAAASVGAMGVTKGSSKFNLRPLPAVREELNRIVSEGNRKALLPGTVVIDEALTEASLRQLVDRSFPILHVASHFHFRPGSERESFLLLGNDTRLTLEQIRRMDLALGHVDLLTLSACQTASAEGRNAQGIEIEGLGVLLLNQGARNVLASLWQVADASTAQLMVEFYSRLAGATKAEALRAAQVALLRRATMPLADRVLAPSNQNYSHPYHWAPFVLIGSGL